MAAGGKNASFNISSHHSPNRDVQSLPAHMFADSHKLTLSNLFLDLLCWSSQPAFLYCCLRHCGRQMSEIEVAYITFVSLEVRVIPEKFIEFISSGLAL